MSGEEEVSKKKAAPSQQKFGFKTLLKKLYKLSSSHIGLIIILLVYTFVGAGLFYWIEGENENKVIASIRQDRDRILGIIVNKSSDDEVDQSKHFDFVQSELRKYEEKLLDAMKHGITLDDENGPGSTEQRVWNIWGAMFYCATIYTTIGYGHIAPSTKEGKVVTMLYATIGIPLCLLVMTDLGKLFTRFIKFLWSFVYRFYRFGYCLAKGKTSSDDKKDEYVVKVDDEFNLHPLVAVFVVIVYIFMGSLMYKYWEDWSYLNAFYFIFITISTIGFGDVIPDHPKYFLATSIYILLGLALVAMVINVYIDFVSNTIDKATCRLSIVSRKIGLSLPNMDDDDEKKPPEGGLKQD